MSFVSFAQRFLLDRETDDLASVPLHSLLLEYGRLYNDETEPGSNDYNGDE